MRKRILELQAAYREGIRILTGAGDADASVDAWYLIEYVTGITRAAYYAQPDKEMTKEQSKLYFQCVQRRSERIPLQHITGEQEFMGYRFRVNKDVLIPRQDTETLVLEALERLRPGMKILDLCTGSGCIILSILKAGREKQHIEGLQGTGTDLSEPALRTARRNAEELGADASFIQSDLFDHVEGRFDLIVSNPPYIRTSVIEELKDEVRLHDPYIALNGGADGLIFYREIITQSTAYLQPGGCLLFETGHDQAEEVGTLMEQAGYSDIRIKKDLAGLDRVVSGMYNEM